MGFRTLGAVILVGAGLAVSPLAAQRATTTFSGVVVDEARGDALPNAVVLLVDEGRGVLSDSLGRFVFEGVRLGPQLLAVKQYGYRELNLDLDLLPGQGPLRVELEPGPIALEGFAVVASNLATMERELTLRRNAYWGSARALPQSRLASTNARDAREFLMSEGGLDLRRCSRHTTGSCVWRRGGLVEPRVYIDEAPVIGGIEFLGMFRPYELYLVEVYSSGLEIRAYTHWYMERMAKRPVKPFPLGL